MAVDVLTETIIDRPRAQVWAYAGDPNNAPDWYVNIKSVEWQSPPPLAVGYKVAFVAPFMAASMKKANQKDLAQLKLILEQ